MKMKLLTLMVVSVLLVAAVHGQQTYLANKQLDCYNNYNSTDGYVCNGASPSCVSYLTFRSIDPLYNSPTSIAYLLDSTPSEIASANNISDVDPIPADTLVLVPVNCSCSGNYSQHNASYTLKTSADTYFGVANNTYQGLTTCQSLMHQNPYDDRNLTSGLLLEVPVRCACPTAAQAAAGFNYLLVYLVTWGDSTEAIAQRFGVDESTLLAANDLSSTDIIYPFTPLLVPLKTKPSPLQLQLPTSPPPSPSPPPPPPPPSGGSSNNKWVFIGVGIGAGCLLLLTALAAFLFLSKRRRRQLRQSPKPNLRPKSSGDYRPTSLLPTTASDDTTKSWSSSGLKIAVESLTPYKFQDLQRATQFFSESNRINGSSVFRATFDGDEAAVKVMTGDVALSGDEINILKRINHSNIIRLSGFCVHQGNTYLVYEFAPSGSLIDCLHKGAISPLSWKQRVQIASDVASALNYLHNFTEPPLIHKNLNSSNILLDANLRAKVANFGLARAVKLDNEDEDGEQGFQQTRHVVGTRGYMAPEYIENGVITPKLDVFAFGVVLLELLSGRRASGDEEHTLLYESISGVLEGDDVRDKIKEFMDPSLKSKYPLDLAFSMAQLAKSCVAPQINCRPTMAQASGTLSKILSSTLDWDPSDAEDLRDSRSLSYGR
ncbi:protein LYK5 [Rosa rugosa]|uniref:protein LYK5 n=1 Tax=Rosa rugosa TaxID=74645 RepID=UPI002B411222|nr:protein LYK5 [Rosa rugosa]